MRLLIYLSAALLVAVGVAACGGDEDGAAPTATPGASEPTPNTSGDGPPHVQGEPSVTDSGLQIIDIEAGTGAEATAADTITITYAGWLENGTEFDSGTITYPLADLIQGWQEGVPGMKVGGKRRLIIPPELAYGATGQGSIPPNATLTFDIELVSIP